MKKNLNLSFSIVVLLLLSTSISFAKIGPPAKNEFVKNPEYSDRKVPATEKKLHLGGSKRRIKSEMKKLENQTKNLCASHHEVFRVKTDKSVLQVTSFKNWNIPVIAKFKNFDGIIYWDKKEGKPKAKLLIDTTSWDSGAPDRDSRVKYYLLKAQKKKFALATLNLESANLKSNAISGSLHLRDREYGIEAKIKREKNHGHWFIRSVAPLRLFGKIPEKDMVAIMKLCNHQALTSVVDLGWDLEFEPACKAKH